MQLINFGLILLVQIESLIPCFWSWSVGPNRGPSWSIVEGTAMEEKRWSTADLGDWPVSWPGLGSGFHFLSSSLDRSCSCVSSRCSSLVASVLPALVAERRLRSSACRSLRTLWWLCLLRRSPMRQFPPGMARLAPGAAMWRRLVGL